MRKIKLQKAKKMKQKFFDQNHGLLLQQLISRNTDIGERMIITLRELEKATDNFDSSRVVGGGGHGVVHLHVEGLISLPWADRIRIALEVARTLSYLHSSASMLIFHIDIKSSTILLDDSFTAKVSDFGASRYIPINQTGVTTIIQGTTGYLDTMSLFVGCMSHYTGRLTDKSDVFSFGVLLIELLTRKKPFVYRSNDGNNLVSYFEKMLAISNLADIVDPQVMEEEDGDLQEVATLAMICTKLRVEDRPTIREVEMTLENLLVKKKLLPCITTPRINNEDATQVQYMSIESATNDPRRQYIMEEEILLSASYPR
ncbi:wall-associated receptor kinase 5-like [Miscanthus floridulus]|uniref:wall-associated receptor kinase 5-like n=1 Tax=Miscanthus floridulus TaxID=154761 RepID=UPI00345A8E7D